MADERDDLAGSGFDDDVLENRLPFDVLEPDVIEPNASPEVKIGW